MNRKSRVQSNNIIAFCFHGQPVWPCMALSDLLWSCLFFYGLALSCMAFMALLWSYMALLWSFMAKYGFDWTCMVFSRGHRSNFIWSCFVCKAFYFFAGSHRSISVFHTFNNLEFLAANLNRKTWHLHI